MNDNNTISGKVETLKDTVESKAKIEVMLANATEPSEFSVKGITDAFSDSEVDDNDDEYIEVKVSLTEGIESVSIEETEDLDDGVKRVGTLSMASWEEFVRFSGDETLEEVSNRIENRYNGCINATENVYRSLEERIKELENDIINGDE